MDAEIPNFEAEATALALQEDIDGDRVIWQSDAATLARRMFVAGIRYALEYGRYDPHNEAWLGAKAKQVEHGE